jgi:protein-S-isoprenylcysteine O-methyltransferase Ste14
MIMELLATELVTDSQSEPSSTRSYRRTFLYRSRMLVTAVLLWGAWGGVLVSPLNVQAGSVAAIVADYCGWLMFFGGLILRVWATRFIGGRKAKEVVCYGPYSLSRNPLYIGTFLMILSLACFLKSLTFAVAACLVIAYYCVAVVPLEERFLRYQLGAAYINYYESVPRWFPRWGGGYRAPALTMISPPMRNELRRAAWWLILPLVASLNLYCRTLPEWPLWLNWP